MDNENNVDAGSTNSGETASESQDTSTADTGAAASQDAGAQDAGGAVEQKAGDACTCPDGRVGTLHANDADDGFVCIPNQG
jgi:hypothetical protein